MKFIKNLQIRSKLLLLLSLLLLPLLYFVITTISRELHEYTQLKQEALQLSESEKVSNLVHVFQKERALMLAASSGDPVMLSEAKAQRNLTDVVVRELTDFVATSSRTMPELGKLAQLSEYRNSLDQNRLDALEFRQYSSDIIFTFLDRIDANATGISDPALEVQLKNFRNLAETKIQLARIRSLMMKAILDNSLSVQDYALFSASRNFYAKAFKDVNRFADEEKVKALREITTSADYKKVEAILSQIEANPQADLSNLDVATVFKHFTKVIEDFRNAENDQANSIRNQLSIEIQNKKQALIALSIILVFILLVTFILSLYIINLVSTSLTTLRTAADRIKQGATDVVIDIDSKDEIGKVASSFKGVLEKNISLAKVAKAIGEGNYDVEVEVQNADDVLSYAIRDMRNNLKQFASENANQNWITAGIAELNNITSGETELNRLSNNVISFLCSYTSSEAGILFLHKDDGKLEPTAGYGLDLSINQMPEFKIGLGKVGQAVEAKKITLLEGVADEYMHIKTGLADIKQSSIIIIPLNFFSNVEGALELSSRQKYTDLQLEFLQAAAERIAVVVYTLKSHLKTEELLYETQNQAEEMETQQEELRQLNAELKASEEELRVNQEELQEKNADLEEKAQLLEEQFDDIRVKNDALEDAREALELKMQQVEAVSKYKSDFLANMSHELRTPLNSILILSRLLADNTDHNLTEKQQDHAQIIHKSGNDLLKLINEILDLSKIESGMIKLETDNIKLSDVSLEPLFREVAARKNIRFSEKHPDGDIDSITTDRFRLEQILKNLIGNAIKFTSEGGEVELSIFPVKNGQRPRFNSEQLKNQSEVIAFSVRDTGIGIPKDKQDVVFEAFQQVDSSTTRKYGGTGLGLTISKELAGLLGGELKLVSEPGKGSTFTLYLPRIVSQENIEVIPKRITSEPRVKAESVTKAFDGLEKSNKDEILMLIIEDDKGFSDILADFAYSKNFNVLQAYNGTDGLQMAKENRPDAILLDIFLPDMTGWEVLQEIRDDKDLKGTSIHLMSAYDKEVTGKFQDNEEYLPKPLTLEMLNKAFSTISTTTEKSIENVLIVEDNQIENKAIGELLLAHGVKTTPALSAEEAEKILAKQKIDCIILDLNLPGMKGYDWMKKLKSDASLSEIPIIIYSGKDLSEEEEARLKEFANTIIIKNQYSYLRLLDEVQLFLHKVNQKIPVGKEFKMKPHVPEEILKAKKVMIADDDVRNIYSLSNLLEMQGMEVVVAYNGLEVLQKLEEERDIDIVLMDIMMPEMDGIEAIKRIRSNSRYKQLPIIALTAKAMKDDKEKCIVAGASDYIPKPVDTDKLLTLMRIWLYEA